MSSALTWIFGQENIIESLNEGGSLSGNEIRKTFDSDPDFAEVFDSVSDFVRKVSENRFQSVSRHFDTTWDEPLRAEVVVTQYKVGDELLAKGEVTSRMLRVLNRIRPYCVGDEANLIEKAIRCLDFSLFGELAETVLARMKP